MQLPLSHFQYEVRAVNIVNIHDFITTNVPMKIVCVVMLKTRYYLFLYTVRQNVSLILVTRKQNRQTSP